MLGTHLHLTLRRLCFNTEWKYAVFWKLKRRTRMMLTWEDAYYDNHEQHSVDNKFVSKSRDGHYLHDPLGLAVAKMSYHVYSLGEGIVGQVAVTGQYQWINADNWATNCSRPLESSDGWQSQFCAGIKTVVVVAVVPHGVVQLGSLNKVPEDMKVVNHIKNVFHALQGISGGYITNPIQCGIDHSEFMRDDFTENSCSEAFPKYLGGQDKPMNREISNGFPSVRPSLGRECNSTYSVSVPNIHQVRASEVINKQIDSEKSASIDEGSFNSPKPTSEVLMSNSQKQMQMKLHTGRTSEGEASVQKDADSVLDKSNTHPHSSFLKALDLHRLEENSGSSFANFPLGFLSSTNFEPVLFEDVKCLEGGLLKMQEPTNMERKKELDVKLEREHDLSHVDFTTSLNFSVGSELHEVLGSTYLKPDKNSDLKTDTAFEMPDCMSQSELTADFGSDNLLEAVVANVCQSSNEIKCEKSFCQSINTLMTTEFEASSYVKHGTGSADYSFDQLPVLEENAKQCLSSPGLSGATSPTGFSSTCPSACSERSAEPVKTKKRARPGENCRPRPRDRQLIQDRIKELRELVPNGSKCSIDSLLERTIKHMFFMQSMTKYSENLKECTESKLCNKDQGMPGSSSYEQGSSWAVEVGSQLKICPIVVENVNMNGLLLVEMMCEECGHFLEIAEAIRSLGLTILKGLSEVLGEKTWISFVVEGQSNRAVHRMDVLWSLVQILQQKAIV